MYILAIETTGPYGSVALIDGEGKVCGFEVSENTKSHLQDLIPMVDAMLKKAGVKKDEITYVAPSIGPGSFTGIRIGVSTARALAQVLGIKCIGVPTLESFLYKERGQTEKENLIACPIINARRGQVYGMIEKYMEADPYMLTEVLERMAETALAEGVKVRFFGDGINAYSAKIEEFFAERFPGSAEGGKEMFCYADEEERHQDAASVAKWALAQFKAQGEDCLVTYEKLLPDYMRKAEAEQKLEAGQLPICKGPKQE